MALQCRSCLSEEAKEYIDLCNSWMSGEDAVSYLECFNQFTALRANATDALPTTICNVCSHDLQIAFDFVQLARRSDVILRETLAEKTPENEDRLGDTVLNIEHVTLIEDGAGTTESTADTEVEEEMGRMFDDTTDSSSQMEFLEVEEVEEHVLEDSVVSEEEDKHYSEDELDDEYLIEYKDDDDDETNSNANGGAKWRCTECQRILRGDVSYVGHMNMHRQTRPYKCQQCKGAFRCKTALERHVGLRHQTSSNAGNLKTCRECDKTYSGESDLNLHWKLMHSDEVLTTCPLCGLVVEVMKEHFRLEHQDEYARHTFPSNKMDAKGMKTRRYWHCTICRASFSSENELRSHSADHVKERIHECTICEKRFAKESSLRSHINQGHWEAVSKSDSTTENQRIVVVECKLCSKQLMHRNLEKHMLVHERKTREANEAQKFLCSYCPRECKSQRSLAQHEKMHRGEEADVSYICNECERTYKTQALLQQHRKQAHKERNHVCSICGNAFKLKNQLDNHMKLHLQKNIQCPQCDKKYARKFDLNVHMRTHTGEMPFVCHICDKRFAIKVRLTYHLQKHYGIKHRCKECNAEFNSKQKLKSHSYKHTGMPYRCAQCADHGFPNRDVFKRHLLRVHNSTMTDKDLTEMFQRFTGKTIRIRPIQELDNVVSVSGDEIIEDFVYAEDMATEIVDS